MTTQDKITHILLLARHLLKAENVNLRIQIGDMGTGYGVWVDHEGFRLTAADLAAQDSVELALDALLATLTQKVHAQMIEATKVLEFPPQR